MPITLAKVRKDLKAFPEEIQLGTYHRLNGRMEEAESYFEAYRERLRQLREETALQEYNAFLNQEPTPAPEILDSEPHPFESEILEPNSD